MLWNTTFIQHLSVSFINVEKESTKFPQNNFVEKCGKLTETAVNKAYSRVPSVECGKLSKFS